MGGGLCFARVEHAETVQSLVVRLILAFRGGQESQPLPCGETSKPRAAAIAAGPPVPHIFKVKEG